MINKADYVSFVINESSCKLFIEESLSNGDLNKEQFELVLEKLKNIQFLEICQKDIIWNTPSIVFIKEIVRFAKNKNIAITLTNFPQEILAFLKRQKNEQITSIQTNNNKTSLISDCIYGFNFLISCIMRCFRFFHKKSSFDKNELFLCIQNSGADAIPIVGMLNLLVGAIIAFVGAIQLEKLGASIFVADLVAISMVREMGAIMTAIILTGRSGASFAANIGTMTVNEEVDALNVLGVNLIDYLVLPKIFALIIVTPLLCILANFAGMLGGALVCLSILNISAYEYVNEIKNCLSMTAFFIGVTKSIAFGAIIATIGCWRGIVCNKNALAVGFETTRAVVYSITALVITDSLFTILLNILNI